MTQLSSVTDMIVKWLKKQHWYTASHKDFDIYYHNTILKILLLWIVNS